MDCAVLLVDDDSRLCELIGRYLTEEGFQVSIACDGAEVAGRLAERAYDALVLDATMPLKGGMDVLRDLHGSQYPPTIMISGRGEEVDRLLGYELGADDYLSKPFRPRELVVRLNALLRRAELARKPASSAIGSLVVCSQTRQAFVDGTAITLTAAEFKILTQLIESQGMTVSRDTLSGFALGRASVPGDRSIDTHVSNLRRKLSDATVLGVRIVAERNLGYSMVPE